MSPLGRLWRECGLVVDHDPGSESQFGAEAVGIVRSMDAQEDERDPFFAYQSAGAHCGAVPGVDHRLVKGHRAIELLLAARRRIKELAWLPAG